MATKHLGSFNASVAALGGYSQGVSRIDDGGYIYTLNTDAVLQAARGNTDTVDQTVLPSAGDGSDSADWVLAAQSSIDASVIKHFDVGYAKSSKDAVAIDNPYFALIRPSLVLNESLISLKSHYVSSYYPDAKPRGSGVYLYASGPAPTNDVGITIPIDSASHLKNTMQSVNIYQWGVVGGIVAEGGALGFVNNPVEFASNDTPAIQRFYDYIGANDVTVVDRTFTGYSNAPINITGTVDNFATKRVVGEFVLMGLVAMDYVLKYEDVISVVFDTDRVYGRGAAVYSQRVVQEGIIYKNTFGSEWLQGVYAFYFKHRGMHSTATNASADNNIAMKFGRVQVGDCGTGNIAGVNDLITEFTGANTQSGFSGSTGQRTTLTITGGTPDGMHENAIAEIDGKAYIVRSFTSTTVDIFPMLPTAVTTGDAQWFLGYGVHNEGAISNIVSSGMTLIHRCGQALNDSSLHGIRVQDLVSEFNGVGLSIGRPEYLHTSGSVDGYYYEANNWDYLELSSFIDKQTVQHTSFDVWEKMANIGYPNLSTGEPVPSAKLHTAFIENGYYPQVSNSRGQNTVWNLELGESFRSTVSVKSNTPVFNIKYEDSMNKLFRYNMLEVYIEGFGADGAPANAVTFKIDPDSDPVTLEGLTVKTFPAGTFTKPVLIRAYLNFNTTTSTPSFVFRTMQFD